MRPNRKEPESAPFLFQILSICCRPHGGLLHWRPIASKARSYIFLTVDAGQGDVFDLDVLVQAIL